MSRQWYYARGHVVYGPISAEEIKDFAARKLLRDTDMLWQEGEARSSAVPVGAALDLSRLSPRAAPAPDWLSDIATTERHGSGPGLSATEDPPEWIEDLRLWATLDLAAETSAGQEQLGNSSAGETGQLPNWIEGWLAHEKPERPPEPPATVPPAVCAPSDPPLPLEPRGPSSPPIPLATPVAPAVSPETPAVPLAPPVSPLPPSPPVPSAVPIAAQVNVGPPEVSLALPDAPAQLAPPPPPSPPAAPAVEAKRPSSLDKVLADSGIDLETGRVIDPQKFHEWKHRHAAPASSNKPAVSNASLMEVFRKGRLAVEAWVDDDSNRTRIMEACLRDLAQEPRVQAILGEYAGYGAEMREKLLRHLAFMVENRRSYYRAMEQRGCVNIQKR